MPLTDTLHVVAELAVAFAGFASLVSIIGNRRARDAPKVDAARIRSMLEASLLVAAFSLVPILSHEAGLSVSSSWRVSSAMFATAVTIIVALQTRRTYLVASPGYQLTRSWGVTAASLWLVTLGGLLATTFGAVRNEAFGYSVGLFAFLVYAALLFIRLIASLLEGSDNGTDLPAA